jgi:hypothetical protein
MDTLRDLALAAYKRMLGRDLADIAIDGRITKAPDGGELAGRSPIDRGRHGLKRSLAVGSPSRRCPSS